MVPRRWEHGDRPADLRPVLGTKGVAPVQVAVLRLGARVVDVVPDGDDEGGPRRGDLGQHVGLVSRTCAPVPDDRKRERIGRPGGERAGEHGRRAEQVDTGLRDAIAVAGVGLESREGRLELLVRGAGRRCKRRDKGCGH